MRCWYAPATRQRTRHTRLRPRFETVASYPHPFFTLVQPLAAPGSSVIVVPPPVPDASSEVNMAWALPTNVPVGFDRHEIIQLMRYGAIADGTWITLDN